MGRRLRPVKSKHKRYMTMLLLTVFVGFLGVTFWYLQKGEEEKLAERLAEKSRLERLLEEEMARADSIDNYKAYVQTKSYIEEVARRVLGLTYKNEIIFWPEDGVD